MREDISKLTMIRIRNGIKPTSTVRILESDPDLYVASIDDKTIAKIGPRYGVGDLVPTTFKLATSGNDYACCVGETVIPWCLYSNFYSMLKI